MRSALSETWSCIFRTDKIIFISRTEDTEWSDKLHKSVPIYVLEIDFEGVSRTHKFVYKTKEEMMQAYNVLAERMKELVAEEKKEAKMKTGTE